MNARKPMNPSERRTTAAAARMRGAGGESRSGRLKVIQRPLSLRVWLTLCVVLVAMIVQAVFATLVLVFVRNAVEASVYAREVSHLEKAAQVLSQARSVPTPAELRALLQSQRAEAISEIYSFVVLSPDPAMAPISSDDRLVMPDLAWTQPLFHAATVGGGSGLAPPDNSFPSDGRLPPRRLAVLERDADATSGPLLARFAAQRVRLAGGTEVALVAVSLDTYGDTIATLVWRVVVVVSSLGIAATGLAIWFIGGLALRPIVAAGVWAGSLDPRQPASLDRPLGIMQFSEFEHLKAELELARARISQALAANERFVANVSHELKTPVATVLAEAQILPLTGATPEVKAFARSVCDEMRRLGNTVDSFLLLSGVRSGQVLKQRSLVNFHDVMLETLSNCGVMARQHQVTLKAVLYEGEDEILVSGSQELLRALLDNIVRNAVRFSPRHGVVNLVVHADASTVWVSVSDAGPGVPAELIERLFERFAQGNSEVGKGRGHGIGLSIAQGIAELHGGKITVRNFRSDETRALTDCTAIVDADPAMMGCNFVVSLPRAAAPKVT